MSVVLDSAKFNQGYVFVNITCEDKSVEEATLKLIAYRTAQFARHELIKITKKEQTK